jgi:thioester reductase-like protein
MTVDATAVYRSHEVLITGANGFVGKVTLGLLLDRFRDFKRLHILMRAKRGYSPRERFEKDVLTSPSLKPVVDRVDPSIIRDKINLHVGDLGEALCGFSRRRLRNCAGACR